MPSQHPSKAEQSSALLTHFPSYLVYLLDEQTSKGGPREQTVSKKGEDRLCHQSMEQQLHGKIPNILVRMTLCLNIPKWVHWYIYVVYLVVLLFLWQAFKWLLAFDLKPKKARLFLKFIFPRKLCPRNNQRNETICHQSPQDIYLSMWDWPKWIPNSYVIPDVKHCHGYYVMLLFLQKLVSL